MLMPGNMRNRIVRHEGRTQPRQGFVLHLFKGMAFEAFQLNAYGVIVAVDPAPVARLPGMPGACIAADKLPQLAQATDKKMRRYL